jgi:tripartite-type tricarboxylate transporter receptor subunit TctC
MTAPTRRVVLTGLAGCAAAAPLTRTFAQGAAETSYPTHYITLVVPFAPGGSTDILARIVGGHLQESLGQPVVIENRTGASGNIGTATVARAAPDGYTFLFNTMSVHTMNHALFASMPFDGVNDFSPIAMLAYVTNTMVVHPSVPAKTVQEFIEYVRANPGKIAYASAGLGSTNHLCAALFEKMTDVKMVHVPYRGGAPAVADTVAGRTQLFFTAGTQSLRYVKAGTLRLLAVTEGKRSSLLPDVPTVGETVPGYEMSVWYGAFGPAGMPRPIVEKLNAEISRILFLPDVKTKMESIAVEVARMTPEELGTLTRNDAEKWGKLIKELGITAQ